MRQHTSGQVWVAGGVYTGNVAIAGDKDFVAIRGGFDPTNWAWAPTNWPTVLDGHGGAAVTVAAGASGNTLSYLTLRGNGAGYGLRLQNAGLAATAEGCTITSNATGIYEDNCSVALTLRNCLIHGNTGDGILGQWANGTHTYYNCTIAGNGANGIYSYAAGTAGTVQNLRNCIISHNGGYGINRGGSAPGTIQTSLFFGNASGDYTGQMTDLGWNKSGRDPKYVDPANGDYSLAPDSPAAGAGMELKWYGVTMDIRGIPRPQGVTWDMGAYEGDGPGETALRSDVYVATIGSDTTGDGSAENPWRTIGYAAGNIAPNGTLYVAGGLYAESVSLGGERDGVAVSGGYDAATWMWSPALRTVIDGGGASAIRVAAGADGIRLASLTLQGATNSGQAGLRLQNSGSAMTVDGCRIVSNRVGILEDNASVTLTVRNGIIARNAAEGVLCHYASGTHTYLNCTIADNGSHGFRSYSSPNGTAPHLKNTLVTGNGGDGIQKNGDWTSGSYEYCLFYGNTNAVVGAMTDLGFNTTTNAPEYADVDDYVPFRKSPAVNSGLDLTDAGVTTDIDGHARPGDQIIDRGAHEGFAPDPPPTGVILIVR